MTPRCTTVTDIVVDSEPPAVPTKTYYFSPGMCMDSKLQPPLLRQQMCGEYFWRGPAYRQPTTVAIHGYVVHCSVFKGQSNCNGHGWQKAAGASHRACLCGRAFVSFEGEHWCRIPTLVSLRLRKRPRIRWHRLKLHGRCSKPLTLYAEPRSCRAFTDNVHL